MQMLRGTVHDPTARRMAGVAGTPACSARRATWRSSRGCCSTAAGTTAGASSRRSRGEDDDAGDARASATCARSGGTSTRRSRRTAASCCRSAPSGTRGSPARRSGSIRRRGMFVIFMSNRLHPDGKGDVTPLRARVATVAASAVTNCPPRSSTAVAWTGATSGRSAPRRRPRSPRAGAERHRRAARERLRRPPAAARRARHEPHRPRARRHDTIDLIHGAKDVTLVALFSPEHGIRGILDANVPSSRDEGPA
jgi:hypothetical protein